MSRFVLAASFVHSNAANWHMYDSHTVISPEVKQRGRLHDSSVRRRQDFQSLSGLLLSLSRVPLAFDKTLGPSDCHIACAERHLPPKRKILSACNVADRFKRRRVRSVPVLSFDRRDILGLTMRWMMLLPVSIMPAWMASAGTNATIPAGDSNSPSGSPLAVELQPMPEDSDLAKILSGEIKASDLLPGDVTKPRDHA